MNWKMIKRETTPVVLGVAMIVNLILSVMITLWMGTALQRQNQSTILAVIVGVIIFLIIGTFLFWISSLILDAPEIEDDNLDSDMILTGEVQILTGIYQGEHLEMQTDEGITLGSNPRESQLIFSSGEVSGKHCRIRFDVERQVYLVIDYSQLGTYLDDGKRLPKNMETQVPRGSIIQIGFTDNYLKLV